KLATGAIYDSDLSGLYRCERLLGAFFILLMVARYAVPLLKHGCAELASAQHTIPAKRFFPRGAVTIQIRAVA
ncbi:MAG: hypothetical protein ACYCYO_14510, partial [Bacilli bacterium]